MEHSQCRNYAGVAVGKDEFIPSLTRLLTRQVRPVADYLLRDFFLALFLLEWAWVWAWESLACEPVIYIL